MKADFVHLHLHTEYSLADSVIRVSELVEAAAAAGMPAVAVTDHCNMFAVVKFYKAALNAGIKPILGADVLVAEADERAPQDKLVLLCRNDEGYANLKRLVTRSYLEGQRNGIPIIQSNWLDSDSVSGLIALSAARDGALGRLLLEGQEDLARDFLVAYRELFCGDFYIELQRTGRAGEDVHNDRAVQLASDAGCALVATNDTRYLRADEFEAHEARTCIHGGYTLDDRERPRLYSDQQYLRSPAEMKLLFGDIPEALENSAVIAQRCNLTLQLGRPSLPDYQVPAGETTASHLANMASAGLEQKLAGREQSKEQRERYLNRLRTELEVISAMEFPGYFLIVADFIRWARNNGVPVGPGRGSGAGSLVAWVIGITNLDPLEFDLLFERFLNPERVSMPDFDIDFCMEGRDRVIEYVADRYGRDRVSQIITYGTLGAKAVIRDVARVMGHPYGFADRIARLVPMTPGMTLEKAFEEEPELGEIYERDDDVHALIDLARQLEGLARNAGTHAGGVVIAPSPLTDFAPLYKPDGETGVMTQFDMKDVEEVGLVKFDFLGLRTLTVIDRALNTANAQRAAVGEEPADIDNIPMDDRRTFALLQSSRTHAVFQLESSGMRDLIKRLKPDCFDDIVALVALFRPGPLQSGMVDTFIERKHGGAQMKIDYLHPSLEPVLANTYGVILYQEQVMQVAQILGGYSLGQADLLRRAMGKKKAEEMAKQRDVFVSGAVGNGIQEKLASHIFGLMEKFAEYGFNKSHSAAYALLAYQTAWLKAHYPEAFMAAVLSADKESTDKLALHHRECKSLRIELLRPDVNDSQTDFTVADKGAIRYGLAALKGLGRAAADAIVAERASGQYRDLHEFCRRIDSQKINRRALEALVKSGALDAFGENRPSLLAALPLAMGSAEQYARDQDAGQGSLFGEEAPPPPPPAEDAVLPRWSPLKFYMNEHQALGLFLSGHPFDQYRKDCSYICTGAIGSVLASMRKPEAGVGSWRSGQHAVLAGLITDIRKRNNRITMYLDDGQDRIELSMYPEAYQGFKHLLNERDIRVVSGKIRFDDFIDGWRMQVSEVKDIDRVIEQQATGLVIRWLEKNQGEPDVEVLRALLEPYRPGRCDVSLMYTGTDATAQLNFGEEWRVRPTGELRDKLAETLGIEAFMFDYQGRTSH
jgi:DNA polymerase-3 subunit alpha